MSGPPPPAASDRPAAGARRDRLWPMVVGAVAIVFGDIGTAPIYAFREALDETMRRGVSGPAILGILSLIIWSLIVVVTLKYVLFLMRAANQGEGGVLALMAQALRTSVRHPPWILALGAAGAALFFGDAIMTPALSVLAAVEGLNTVRQGAGLSELSLNAIAIAILVGLFLLQRRGTAYLSRLLGPVCLAWFLTLAALGIRWIVRQPSALAALDPRWGVDFLLTGGGRRFPVLGAVFLTVVGAEAITAAMGHFGRGPIRRGWLLVVFPSLVLNYLGQGALAFTTLIGAHAIDRPPEGADWFFLMAPPGARLALIVLATLMTMVASQAMITSAYSLALQAMRLGLLPWLKVRRTSEQRAGQVYLPTVNWLLLAGVLALVLLFRNSSAMSAAYGIAVAGTMTVSTLLAFLVVRRAWGWGLPAAAAIAGPFLLVDLLFLAAKAGGIVRGGWLLLLTAGLVATIIYVWFRGRALLADASAAQGLSVAAVAERVRAEALERVPGTAVFLTTNPGEAPAALLQNLEHNHVLHARNILLDIATAETPTVPEAERLSIGALAPGIERATLAYGFMEEPAVARDLAPALEPKEKPSYFTGRYTWIATRDTGLPYWQDKLFGFLMRNSAPPAHLLGIPADRVVELGTQIAV